MNSVDFSGTVGCAGLAKKGRRLVVVTAILLLGCAFAPRARAQVVYSGKQGGLTLSAGATGSGYLVQYGEQKLAGVTAVVDLDTRSHFGVEGEARWLVFFQTNQLKATTWLAGPRYQRNLWKFQVYGKGLVGLGQFTYPYNLAHGNYLVVAPGAGVDYQWKRHITFRLADFEYQVWPNFTYGTMSSGGVSAGVLYHIF